MILIDPDRAFEWIAKHEEVQIDEFRTVFVVIGTGMLFSPSADGRTSAQQVDGYKRLQAELRSLNRDAFLMGKGNLCSLASIGETYK